MILIGSVMKNEINTVSH